MLRITGLIGIVGLVLCVCVKPGICVAVSRHSRLVDVVADSAALGLSHTPLVANALWHTSVKRLTDTS